MPLFQVQSADQLRERGAVENGIHGFVGALPEVAQWRIRLTPKT